MQDAFWWYFIEKFDVIIYFNYVCNSAIFISAFINREQLLKDRICSLGANSSI